MEENWVLQDMGQKGGWGIRVGVMEEKWERKDVIGPSLYSVARLRQGIQARQWRRNPLAGYQAQRLLTGLLLTFHSTEGLPVHSDRCLTLWMT